jgi:hypothetical protein
VYESYLDPENPNYKPLMEAVSDGYKQFNITYWEMRKKNQCNCTEEFCKAEYDTLPDNLERDGCFGWSIKDLKDLEKWCESRERTDHYHIFTSLAIKIRLLRRAKIALDEYEQGVWSHIGGKSIRKYRRETEARFYAGEIVAMI